MPDTDDYEPTPDFLFQLKRKENGAITYSFVGKNLELEASLALMLAKHPQLMSVCYRAIRRAKAVLAEAEAGDEDIIEFLKQSKS